MKGYKTLLILGIVTLLIPFLGVPEVYKNWAVAIIGAILVICSFGIRYLINLENGSGQKEMFVESSVPDSNEEILEQGQEFEDMVSEENNA